MSNFNYDTNVNFLMDYACLYLWYHVLRMNFKYPCFTLIPHVMSMHEQGFLRSFDLDLTINYEYDYDFKAIMVMTWTWSQCLWYGFKHSWVFIHHHVQVMNELFMFSWFWYDMDGLVDSAPPMVWYDMTNNLYTMRVYSASGGLWDWGSSP